MNTSTPQVIITGDMTYAAALAALAAAWPNLPFFCYWPTVEHYKEGRPTAEELELEPDAPMSRSPGRRATVTGGMRGQLFHSEMMGAFSVETELRGGGLRSIWMASLDEANAGIRRTARDVTG